MTDHIELDRKFWPAEADNENKPENIRIMFALGIDEQLSWDDLLEKYRTVIIAEPGTGKTAEFQAVTKRLQMEGKPAFFLRIELLQSEKLEVRNSLDIGTEEEFDKWLAGENEAYFFLDSVDEALLTSRTAFDIALRRFSKTISESLDRAKIFVSCRVSNWRATADLALFSRHLPSPKPRADQKKSAEETEHATKKAISTARSIVSEEKEDHIVFQLAPLNDRQIQLFAAQKGVDETKNFLEAIERADANIFAERPQDLLDLIEYWRSHGRLGRHAAMLDFNIQKKLQEPDLGRDYLRPLSVDDALLGAERLAAAVTLQKKKAIILPDIPIDFDLRDVSIEPKELFPDWSPDMVQILLDRAIFDEAIYGTVRFHHRTVQEYLVATWLKRLIKEEKSRRLIEDLLFSKQHGIDVVIPSMRPVAAWLSLWDDRVRNQLRKIEPEVLIENGDPASLSIESRKSLLIGFAEHYAKRQYTGVSFDITMIRRLADSQLASTINDLLKKYRTRNDICILLLELIWQGKISGSVDEALSIAMDNHAHSYSRKSAIRAVAAAGTLKQQRKLVKSLLADISKLSSNIFGEVCSMFFPKALSIPQLLKILRNAKTPERYSVSQLKQSIDKISNNIDIPEREVKRLLQGLYKLLKSRPFIEHHHCEISQRYGWLLPCAIRLANRFIHKNHDYSFDPIVLELFLSLFGVQDYGDFYISDRDELIKEAKAWPKFRYQLFWHVINVTRDREKDSKKHPTGWWQVRWYIDNFWMPSTDDLEWLFEDLGNKPAMDDRSIALTAIFTVYVDEKRPQKLRERMKHVVNGTPELEIKLHELLDPKPLSEEQKKWRRQERNFKLTRKDQERRQKTISLNNKKTIKRNSADIINVGNPEKGKVWERTVYLYDRIREKREEVEHGLGHANWKALEDEFGFEVAKNFRDGCVAYWRGYDPFTFSDRRTSNTIPWARIIGLTGLAMEAADDPDWAKKISRNEARIVAHYSVCEINGFPLWFNDLQSEFSGFVEEVIKDELRWELHENPSEKISTQTLSAIRYSNTELNATYKNIIFDLLSEQEPANGIVLDHSLSFLLQGRLDDAFKSKIAKLALQRFKATTEKKRKYTWLIVLLSLDGIKGCQYLKAWIRGLSSVKEKKETMANFCAALTDHGNARFDLTVRDYERIEVLEKLMPFIYQFVKAEEDNRYDGIYTPGIRDHAQQTRSHLLNVIFDTPGQESYDVLIKLSKTVTDSFSKDHMSYLAKERAALDAEFAPWTGSAVAEFSLSPTKIPRYEADLYELALVRLDDLKLDIEDGDESESVLLQKLTQETEVRTIFANRLRRLSCSLYTVGSEEELADATKTDIRITAPQVSAPVPIELKIAEKWSFRKLRERLENQLIGQYMRVSRFGIFLLVHSKNKKRRWRDAHTNKLVSFTELVEALKQDLDDLIRKHPNVENLEIIGIDFTIR